MIYRVHTTNLIDRETTDEFAKQLSKIIDIQLIARLTKSIYTCKECGLPIVAGDLCPQHLHPVELIEETYDRRNCS